MDFAGAEGSARSHFSFCPPGEYQKFAVNEYTFPATWPLFSCFGANVQLHFNPPGRRGASQQRACGFFLRVAAFLLKFPQEGAGLGIRRTAHPLQDLTAHFLQGPLGFTRLGARGYGNAETQ